MFFPKSRRKDFSEHFQNRRPDFYSLDLAETSTKSERKVTHPGGCAAWVGLLVYFRLALCGGSVALCVAFVRWVVSLYPCRLSWLCVRFCGFLRGQRKTARNYSGRRSLSFPRWAACLARPPMHTGGEFFGRCHWYLYQVAAVRR